MHSIYVVAAIVGERLLCVRTSVSIRCRPRRRAPDRRMFANSSRSTGSSRREKSDLRKSAYRERYSWLWRTAQR